MRILLILLVMSSVLRAQNDSTFRIYFQFGKYTPVSSVNPFLKLDSTKWIPQVQLIGKTDTSGNTEFNRQLADFRIKAVKEMMAKRRYFKAGQTTIIGESSASANYNAATERCVEVRLIRKKGAPSARIKSTLPNTKKEDDPATAPEVHIPRNFHPDSVIAKGDVLVLKNILFELNETILLSESYAELDQLLRVMKKNPKMRIHIRGHVCCSPSMELSVKRAEKIYSYLLRNGISDSRMSYKGYSNKSPHPLYLNDLYNQEHRRVEIEILEW